LGKQARGGEKDRTTVFKKKREKGVKVPMKEEVLPKMGKNEERKMVGQKEKKHHKNPKGTCELR